MLSLQGGEVREHFFSCLWSVNAICNVIVVVVVGAVENVIHVIKNLLYGDRGSVYRLQLQRRLGYRGCFGVICLRHDAGQRNWLEALKDKCRKIWEGYGPGLGIHENPSKIPWRALETQFATARRGKIW